MICFPPIFLRRAVFSLRCLHIITKNPYFQGKIVPKVRKGTLNKKRVPEIVQKGGTKGGRKIGFFPPYKEKSVVFALIAFIAKTQEKICILAQNAEKSVPFPQSPCASFSGFRNRAAGRSGDARFFGADNPKKRRRSALDFARPNEYNGKERNEFGRIFP